MDIISLQNPRVKNVVKLREDKRQRQHEGLILVEGWDEISLALTSGFQPHTLFTAPELVSRQIEGINSEILTVNRAVFEKMSYRENPDGWLALFPTPQKSLEKLKLSANPLIIAAESVEKPGNLGAILRTADAANVDALFVCDRRVDLYNPNVIRASRGAIFSVTCIEMSNQDALDYLRAHKMKILSATPQADMLYTDVDLTQPLAIAVGTEDNGLTNFWLSNADVNVKIPMLGKVNSLNVSIATALITYEALRQRS
ncbi:MAG: RNA methyltransferase [Anaerolineales bacterium]|nr:RNA methyltransferase [Anaerolineales bacterium]